MNKGLIALVLVIFVLPINVNAHLVGQPPFFKINGEYSDLYPVPTSSVTNFDLPQDIAKKNHLVGETLEMEMDVNQLPILPEVIDNTQFIWDFGDGTQGTGLKNTHIYTKQGSYILNIQAKYRTDEPQLIQSVLINVLPDVSYQLPVARITANGKEANDPLADVLYVDFKKDVYLNSDKSTASGGITAYYWDLGDSKSSADANPKYKYDPASMQVFPVLRVKDANGFFADAFVQLDSEANNDPGGSSFDTWSGFFSWPMMAIGLIVLAVAGGIWLVKKQIRKQK